MSVPCGFVWFDLIRQYVQILDTSHGRVNTQKRKHRAIPGKLHVHALRGRGSGVFSWVLCWLVMVWFGYVWLFRSIGCFR